MAALSAASELSKRDTAISAAQDLKCLGSSPPTPSFDDVPHHAGRRRAILRMPVQLGHLLQASGSDVGRMWTERRRNDEAPKGLEISQAPSGLSLRAIQDSNLWPLAPEANALSS